MGDVDDHLVGPRPLHLEVARGTGRHGIHTFSGGDGPAFGLLQPVAGFVQVVYYEADVVDAVVIVSVGSDVGIGGCGLIVQGIKYFYYYA